MKRLDYIDLFTKKVIGSISNEELKDLEDLSKTPETQKEIESLQKVWDASQSYDPKVSFNSTDAFKKFKSSHNIPSNPAPQHSKGFSIKMMLSAVAIVVSIGLLVWLIGFNTDDITNKSDSVKTHTLDQAEVWLNTNASITELSEENGTTHMDLEGLVYIDNSKKQSIVLGDKTNPVTLEKAKVSVYKDEDNQLEINVEEGSVSYDFSGKRMTAMPGERMIINPEGVPQISMVLTENAFSWRLKTLQFINTPMDLVFDDLEGDRYRIFDDDDAPLA